MQAIRTRYMPATNTRGARIQAKCEARTINVGYDHALDAFGNHGAACLALGRDTTMVDGEFAGDHYWCFVRECDSVDLRAGV